MNLFHLYNFYYSFFLGDKTSKISIDNEISTVCKTFKLIFKSEYVFEHANQLQMTNQN